MFSLERNIFPKLRKIILNGIPEKLDFGRMDWSLGLWTTGLWTPGRLDAWTLGHLDTWTFGLCTPRHLDSGRLDAWTPLVNL